MSSISSSFCSFSFLGLIGERQEGERMFEEISENMERFGGGIGIEFLVVLLLERLMV